VEHETLQGQRAPAITRIRENAVYKNRFATVYDDDVAFGDGSAGRYWRLAVGGGDPGVAVLPVCDGKIALVHVFRYAVGAWEWAIPRGYAHGGDAAVTAAAELAEELGSPPGRLEPLGEMTPDSGHLTVTVRLFMAYYADPVSSPRDTSEVAGVRWVPVPDLLAAIAAGDIIDGFTLAAVCAAMCRKVL
jgi:8-oxo-dGTP pyrophosphatase MutT (NUDIX family)